jgi:hypothetical protein
MVAADVRRRTKRCCIDSPPRDLGSYDSRGVMTLPGTTGVEDHFFSCGGVGANIFREMPSTEALRAVTVK